MKVEGQQPSISTPPPPLTATQQKKELQEQLQQQQDLLAELEHQEAAELEAATDNSRREYLLEKLDKVLTDDRCAQVTKHLAEMVILEHKITSSHFTNWDDHFDRLERRVDDLAAQQSKIQDAIQNLTAQLSAAKLIAAQLPLIKPKPSPPSTPPSSPPGSVHSPMTPHQSQKASGKATYADVAAGDQRGPKILAPNKFRGDDPKTDVGDWAAGTKAYLRGFVCPEQTKVVDKYADLMQEPFGLPNRPTKHHIELLPGAVPPKGRIYRMSPAELEELRKQLETLTSKGWIRPSTSEFGAPVLFVPKGNGEFKMCIDYRGLNKITRKSTKPLPRIDDLLDMVQGCTVFNKVDLKSGYHQIEMAEGDVYKTAFKTRYGTYEFLVMPFGLCNAPGTFQTEMHRISRPYLDKFMVVYLDDILVFSRTAREHAEHLALVLQSLRDSQYKINREKSSLRVPFVIYLGHVISGDGLAPEAAKIVAIQDWPQPQTVRYDRSFMGLASYYRKFVRNFSAVAAALTNLTKKDTPFLWSLPCQLAFTRLKKALTRAPVLKLPDPTLPFILTTDASQYGIGAVLQQDDGNGLRPVEFMSKKIKTQKLQDSTYEKELYALVCALKHWKHFLLGKHFKIFSDHSTLQWMKSQGELNDKLARYIQFIDMFYFELKHKKGCYNKVADVLSRRPDSFALISSTHSFGEEIRHTIARLLPQDETFGPIVRNLQADPNSEPGYALSSDLLYTYSRGEERLCIPQDQRLRTLLMSECHDARGHFGFLKSYASLSQRFFWKEMRSDMLRYVDTFELCQRNKIHRRPPLGLLKPLPIPDGPAESMAIDFTDLGKTTPRGMRQVMVCVDRFSKYAKCIPLPKVARVPAVRAAFSESHSCLFLRQSCSSTLKTSSQDLFSIRVVGAGLWEAVLIWRY
ncbi:hypothetical protein CBR_g48998 [Chara braunii]|uniref:Reverse transcriptase domain-containing protein n=1 Tax=Chara braunii TaxID=69332 RepID=A0A388M4A2_CHABU|nr:hypothetical protein CBR_g48998 [Chara braunii]|eukprot:GBG89289.1 hypothetical protein CBR_g48998 [Chara braunii]